MFRQVFVLISVVTNPRNVYLQGPNLVGYILIRIFMTGTSYLNNVTLIKELTVSIYCELTIENLNYKSTII